MGKLRPQRSWTAAGFLFIFIYADSTNSAFSSAKNESLSRHYKPHWSTWEPWSDCSRTCGSGVSVQQRTCLRRRNGLASTARGSHCVGLYRRYKMCNRKACPVDSKDFREVQCEMYNTMPLMDEMFKWEAIIKPTNPCQLHCRATGQRFFAKLSEKVIDGTPCRNDSKIDICVDGMCKRVGCDGILGSGLVLDMCGVCGGSNTQCAITRSVFDKSDLSVGYHVIVTVPVGATHINVTELSRSRNYLALQTVSGKSIVNGDWHIDYPGNFSAVGTVFRYERSARTQKGEQILADGPTNQEIEIMMIYQQQNPGIFYEFSVPQQKPGGLSGEYFNPTAGSSSYYSSPAAQTEEPTDQPQARPQNDNVDTFTAHLPASSQRQPPPSRYTPSGSGGTGGSFDGQQEVPARNVPLYYADPSGTAETRVPGGSPGQGGGSQYLGYDSQGQRSNPGSQRSNPGSQRSNPGSQQYQPNLPQLPIADSPYHVAQYPVGGTNSRVTNRDSPPRGSSTGPGYPPRGVSRNQYRGTYPYYYRYQYNQQNQAEQKAPISVGVYQAQPGASSSSVEEESVPFIDNSNMNQVTYMWMKTGMTTCSASCAGGVQGSVVQCVQNNNLSPVTDSMCEISFKPTSEAKACNTQPCPPEWYAGDWGECSTLCGPATQHRQVMCKQQMTQALVTSVAMDRCDFSQKPDVMQQCDQLGCASWVADDWGECSEECGDGQRQRAVFCRDDDGETVDESRCADQEKPDTSEDCNRGECIPKWIFADYSNSCSAECGTGQRSRNVVCSDSGGSGALNQDLCGGKRKPRDTKPCIVEQCSAKWVASDWQQCSEECGPGTQSRLVLCVSRASPYNILEDAQCRGTTKPVEQQDCQMKRCESSWYKSEWSECSKTCGGGTIKRTVKCLDFMFGPSKNCSDEARPTITQPCNPHSCEPRSAAPRGCRDRYGYCKKVAKSALLCSYSYYKWACCFSCHDHSGR